MEGVSQIIAAGVVITAGLFLITLAGVAFARPALAAHFLLSFAKTAATHYVEMAARIVVGIALIVASPGMLFSSVFFWFGAALLASSVVLLCLPWQWHRSIGERVLPTLVSLLGVVSLVSLLLGALLVAATIVGAA